MEKEKIRYWEQRILNKQKQVLDLIKEMNSHLIFIGREERYTLQFKKERSISNAKKTSIQRKSEN